MIEQGRLSEPRGVLIANPHVGKGKQLTGMGLIVFGFLMCFAFAPLGVVLIVGGGALAFVGGCQRWYHWK